MKFEPDYDYFCPEYSEWPANQNGRPGFGCAEGAESISPGLAQRDYPGNYPKKSATLKGLAAGGQGRQPFQGWKISGTIDPA